MAKQTNTPQLRFPGFTEPWEKKNLEMVSDKIQDGTHFSPQILEQGEYLYITSKNVKNGYIELSNAQYISKDAHLSIYKRCDVKKGDVLITKDGTIGQVCVNELDQEFSLLSSVAFIRPKDDFLNYFIYQVLVSPVGQKEIESHIAGQALKRITLTKINNFIYNFPTLPEQQKIADFLTTVDDKLQALQKKKSLLEQYKKGIMQKIFSQELRFKDENGKEYPKWDKKKLGEIGDTYSGLSGKTKEDFGDGKPYIQYKQIFDDSRIDISRFEFVKIAKKENQNKVQYGDVFFTISSETPKEIGTASVLLDDIEELYLNSFCFGYRAYSLHILSPYFSRYLFRSELFRKEIVKLAQGSTRYNMSKTELMKIPLLLPCLEEQTKIAKFLSSIDEKIQSVQQQIDKTTLWKKGLLQQMFC